MRSAILLASLLALQIQPVQITQQRDQPPPEQRPTVRMVPVGTSSIGGTVTAADTGRPIRGARVQVNGTIASAFNRGRGAGPGSSSGPLPPGVSLGPGVASTSGVTMSAGRGGGPGSNASGPMYMNNASRTATTDDLGNYLIDKLPAGQYQVTISAPRNTYLQASYGQKKFGGTPGFFQLADAQRAKINMALMRGGVITGTVFSEDGEPQGNTQVQAYRYMMNGGVKRLQQTGYAQTDDRGVYRMFGLQPGDYIVAATPDSNALMQFGYSNPDDALIEQAIASGAINPPREPGMPSTVAIPIRSLQEQQQLAQQRQIEGPPPGYLPIYHPGTPVRTGATRIRIDGGDERTSVDVQLRLIQATNITGTIQNPPGPGLGVQLSLTGDDPLQQNSMGSSRVDNNGRFTLRNIQPGKYTLLAQIVPSPTTSTVNGVTTTTSRNTELDESQRWWGRALVNVEGQPSITQDLTLKPGRTISGRVVFEMERIPDLTRQKVMVNLSPAPGAQYGYYMNPLPAELAPDGTFTLKGVIPGKYTLRAQVGVAKSVMVNGQDLLDFPLDFTGDRNVTDAVITVTDKSSEVSGTLIDTTGKPAADYSIVAAAADERFWTPNSRRVVMSRPSAEGTYTLRNLPPGEYLLAAVRDLEQGEQYDPEFLKSLASAAAMRILVVEGGKITQDLRVAR